MMEILRSGSHLTLVDTGRYGYRKYGVPISGSMDQISAARANSLLSNPLNCALLEMYLSGHQIKFHQNTQIALAGAKAEIHLNGQLVHTETVISVTKNSVLSIGTMYRGARMYLAIEGGIDSSVLLNSRSSIPGYFQRKLIKGDKLSYLKSRTKQKTMAAIKALHIAPEQPILCSTGPEWYMLSSSNRDKILKTKYLISYNSNRMGYRLDGEKVENNQIEIYSSVVLPGTVQLLPNGLPIILMRECQTTGGYPRILQVRERDINQLAQRRPGQSIHFQMTSLE